MDLCWLPLCLEHASHRSHAKMAVIERLILTLKMLLHCLPLVPLRKSTFRREIGSAIDWYNKHRPHTTLGGRTPDEVYFSQRPANRSPRFEPRALWPRSGACALPQVLVKGQPGVGIELGVSYQQGHRHLPVVTIRRAA